MADPATTEPKELRPPPVVLPDRASELLRRRDFRRLYLAVGFSELGDAFQYIALMWFALEAGGPLGVVAVRLADSIPALVFGLHGGLVADRLDRRRTMVAADLARAAVLVPVSVAGLAGELPLWGLVVAAFLLTTAASYFEPAYGAILPALVERRNVQPANGLVRATADAVSIGGWAVAAGLLAFMPISAFFALNAASFLVSAALLGAIGVHPRSEQAAGTGLAEIRAGIDALRPRPALAAAAAVLGVAITIESGTWMVGVPELVRNVLGHGAGAFATVMVGYSVGSIAAGLWLASRPIRRKAYASLLAWALYLPAYGLMALAPSIGLAVLGAVFAGLGQGSAYVLVNAAAQEQVPDRVLGRVMGLITLVHRGAHATGLLLVSPLFALVPARAVFAGAAVAAPLVGIAGAGWAFRATRRAAEARGRASGRSPRSGGTSLRRQPPRRQA